MPNKTTVKPVSQDPKVRDMIRSLLPCTRSSRKNAFLLKRMECRQVRRRVRHYIRACDAEGYTEADLFIKPRQKSNVDNRRLHDKVNPFLRWCTHHTRGMSKQEALDYVRAILPHNTIGDHAFSHWKMRLGIYR